MPRSIDPLTIRMQLAGDRQVEGGIRRTAGSFNVVVEAAGRADRTMQGAGRTARDFVMAGRGVEATAQSFDKTGNAAGVATRKIAGMNSELRDTDKSAEKVADGLFNADKRATSLVSNARQLGVHLKTVVGHAQTVYSVFGAIASRSPLKLFDAIVPQAIKTKIGMGMIAGGVGLSAMLGSTINPAMEKQSRLSALEGFTKSPDVSRDIYNTTDQLSSSSVFNLPELVVAAKTLTKDRQFYARFLKASDDLAAANKDEGTSPQDVARALGRLRAGDAGEAFERFRDFGIGRPDLEGKGLKFDGQGALEDKSADGISKAVDAVVSIIEERFGGLSERLATTTLEGSLSNLSDEFGRFKTTIGESFIPVLNVGAQTIRTFAMWLNSLSPATKTAIAWGTALTAGLLIFGGTALIVGGTIAKVVFIYKALNFVLGLAGYSVGGLSRALVMQLLPSLGMVALGIGLIAVAAWGLKTAYEGTLDASRQSSEQLEYHWGALGKFWAWAGELLDKFWNHPLIAKVLNVTGGNIVGNWFGLGRTTEDESEGDKKKRLANANRARKREGKKALTMSQFEASERGEVETVDQVRKREEAKAKRDASGGALADWQKQQAAMWAKMGVKPGGGAGIMPSMGSGRFSRGSAEQSLFDDQSPDVQAAQEKVDQLQADIEALQDRRANTDDKALKQALGDQIRQRQRLLRAARRELAATRKLAARREKEAAHAEKVADKVGDIEFDIKKAGVDDKFASQVDATERELKAAKTAGDALKIRRLTQQKGNIEAQKGLELAMMEADREKDAKVRAALRRKAQFDFRFARNAATRDAMNAAQDAKEEQQNIIERGNVDVGKADRQNATDARIAPLEEALEKAKEDADQRRIRAIVLQIEGLRAEQAYADEMADATLEDNKEKRKQMERLAQRHRTGALQKAIFAADKAVRDSQKSDADKDKGSRATIEKMKDALRGARAGAGWNDGGGGFAAMNRASEDGPKSMGMAMTDGVPSLASFGDVQSMQRERTARVASISQRADGGFRIKFDEIDLPYTGIGDVGVN